MLKERSVMVVGVTFAYAPVKTTVSGVEVEFTVTYVTLVPTASSCKLLVVYEVVVMLGAVVRLVLMSVVMLITVTIAVPVVEVLIVVPSYVVTAVTVLVLSEATTDAPAIVMLRTCQLA
jgi:hypothetical protein